MALGDGTSFGMWLGLDNGALMNGINTLITNGTNALIKESPKSSPKKSALTWQWIYWHLDLGLPRLQNNENKFLLSLSHKISFCPITSSVLRWMTSWAKGSDTFKHSGKIFDSQKVGNKSTKIQGPSSSVKLLRIQWYMACQGISSKVKVKLLQLAPPESQTRHDV